MEDEEVGAGMLGSDHRNEGDDSCGNSVVGAAGGQALSTTAVAGTQGAASSTSLLDQPSRGFKGASTLGPRLCHTESATGGSKVSWEPSGEAQLRCPLQLQRDDLFSLTHAENTSVTGRGQRAEEGVCAFHAEDSSRQSEGDSISVGEAIELMTALQESSLLHTCNRVVEDALPDDLLRLLSLPCSANEPLESREQGGLTTHQNRGTPKEKEMRQWLQPVAAHDRETDRGDRLSATDGFVGRTGHNSQRLGLMDGYKPQEAFTPTGLLPQHTYGRPPGQDGVLVRGRRSISSGSRFTADDRTVADANCLSTGCQIVANRHGEPLCSTDSTRSEESGSESSPSSPCNTPGACCDSPASASAKRDNNHTTVRAHAWADASLKEFEVGTAAGSSTNLIRGACTLQSGVARAECNVAARNSYGQIHRSGTANIADRAKISDYSAMHKAMPKVTGVRFQAQRNRFVAEWYERGRTRMAYFPVKLYGFDRARNMAIRRREEVLQMKLAKSNVKGDVGGSPASAHGRGNLSVRSGAVEMVTPTSKRRRLVDSYTPSATPAPCRNTFPIETATPRFTSSRRPALLPLATCESKPAKETPITEVLLRSPVRTSSERADPEAGCEVGLKRRREDHILPTLLEQQRRLWTPETTRVVAAGGAARVDARDISLCDLLERAVAAAGTQGKARLRRRCEESFSEGLGIRPDIRSSSHDSSANVRQLEASALGCPSSRYTSTSVESIFRPGDRAHTQHTSAGVKRSIHISHEDPSFSGPGSGEAIDQMVRPAGASSVTRGDRTEVQGIKCFPCAGGGELGRLVSATCPGTVAYESRLTRASGGIRRQDSRGTVLMEGSSQCQPDLESRVGSLAATEERLSLLKAALGMLLDDVGRDAFDLAWKALYERDRVFISPCFDPRSSVTPCADACF